MSEIKRIYNNLHDIFYNYNLLIKQLNFCKSESMFWIELNFGLFKYFNEDMKLGKEILNHSINTFEEFKLILENTKYINIKKLLNNIIKNVTLSIEKDYYNDSPLNINNEKDMLLLINYYDLCDTFIKSIGNNVRLLFNNMNLKIIEKYILGEEINDIIGIYKSCFPNYYSYFNEIERIQRKQIISLCNKKKIKEEFENINIKDLLKNIFNNMQNIEEEFKKEELKKEKEEE